MIDLSPLIMEAVMLRNISVAIIITFSFFLQCTPNQSTNPDDQKTNNSLERKGEGNSLTKDITKGEILDYSMPEYKSYYFNDDPELKAAAEIENPSAAKKTYVVKFSIKDDNGFICLIKQMTAILEASCSTVVDLTGSFPDTIRSGWFTGVIELYWGTTLCDEKIKPDAFSAFHKSESYNSNVITDYDLSNYAGLYYEECSTYVFGYLNTNISVISGALRIQIPSGQSDRKGGESFLNTRTFQYGQLKGLIKMNLDAPFTLGAFWLWDRTYGQDAIVMEIYKNSGDQFVADCYIYKGNPEVPVYNPGSYVLSIDPKTSFYEYKIDWKSEFVDFYVDSQRIRQCTDPLKIPSSSLSFSYNYRMTNWSGGYPHQCLPALPPDTTEYLVDWACW